MFICNEEEPTKPSVSAIISEPMVEPTDLAEAETLRKDLTLDVQSIQAQLSDRTRTDENGVPLSKHAYQAWKKRAQYKLNQKLDELRAVKAWIKANRPTSTTPTTRQAFDHLRRMVEMLEVIRDQELGLETEDLAQILAARIFLDNLD